MPSAAWKQHNLLLKNDTKKCPDPVIVRYQFTQGFHSQELGKVTDIKIFQAYRS